MYEHVNQDSLTVNILFLITMTDEAVETSDTPVWVTLEDVLFASVLVAMRNAIQHSHPPESEGNSDIDPDLDNVLQSQLCVHCVYAESTINAVRQIAASSLPAEFRQSLRGLSVANHVSHQSCQMDSSYNSMEQQLLEARLGCVSIELWIGLNGMSFDCFYLTTGHLGIRN